MTPTHPTLDALRVATSSLELFEHNPRRGDVDAIKRSLERHGQYRPIVVNARTQQVLAGNHTLLAARELGWDDIAATFVDVAEDMAARIVLADNRTPEADTSPQLGDVEYRLIVECDDEHQQAELLQRLEADGLRVKALAQ
jgi:ParB-like chromosome segregation protein Spo0J